LLPLAAAIIFTLITADATMPLLRHFFFAIIDYCFLITPDAAIIFAISLAFERCLLMPIRRRFQY